MEVGRPEALGQVLTVTGERQRGDVVQERVEPHVHPLLGVPGQPHPPFQLRTGEGDVVQAALDERDRLVAAEIGDDEVRAFLVEPFELPLEGGQSEEPVLLALSLQRDLVDRAGLIRPQLPLSLEVRAAGAVPALVGAL